MAPRRSQGPYTTEKHCIQRSVYEDGVLVDKFFCSLCDGSVTRKGDFQRHMRTHNPKGRFICTWPGCTHTKGFTQKSNMEQHINSVHRGIRYSCPHSWVQADGTVYECTHLASDPSGLIRHRSTDHGFEAGDDKAKIAVPTPEGATFPDSKYANRNREKRKASEDDEEPVENHGRRTKRAKTTPAPSSSSSASSSSTPAPKKKSRSKRRISAPSPAQGLGFDWSSMHTLPASQSSTPSPIAAADWDLGFGSAQSQPATGMGAADPLAFPYLTTPAQVDTFDALLTSEAQKAAANNWSLAPHMDGFNFDFTGSALPSPGYDGTIDPNMLTRSASFMPATSEQASLTNAGYASLPNFYAPSHADSGMMTMGWQPESYSPSPSTPGSSRESTASPVPFNIFDDLALYMPNPDAREPVSSGFFPL